MKSHSLRLRFAISLLVLLALACATFASPTPTPTPVPPTATPSPTPMPDYEAMIEDGWAAFDNDDMETASEIVEEVLAQDQSLANAWALSGAVHYANQEYDEAIENLERALAIDEDHVRALELLITAYQFRITVLITFISNTYNPDAIVEGIREARKILDDLNGLGDTSERTLLFNGVLNRDPDYGIDQNLPDDAFDHFEQAEAHFRNEEYDQAIAEYENAIEDYEDFAVAHLYLGDAYYVQGEYEQAIDYMQRAVGINPQLVQGWGFLGDAYTNLGLGQRARVAFVNALYLDVENEIAYNGLGRINNVVGNWDPGSLLSYDFLFYFDRELEIEAMNNADFSEPDPEKGAVRIDAPEYVILIFWQPWDLGVITPETGSEFVQSIFADDNSTTFTGDAFAFEYGDVPMVVQFYDYDSPDDDIERSGASVVATCDTRLFVMQFEYVDDYIGDLLVVISPYLESFRCNLE